MPAGKPVTVASVNGKTGHVVLDPADFGGATYTHNQATASSTWTIVHNLGRFPSVTVVDSSGRVVLGDVLFADDTTVVISFSAAFGGKAYLN